MCRMLAIQLTCLQVWSNTWNIQQWVMIESAKHQTSGMDWYYLYVFPRDLNGASHIMGFLWIAKWVEFHIVNLFSITTNPDDLKYTYLLVQNSTG